METTVPRRSGPSLAVIVAAAAALLAGSAMPARAAGPLDGAQLYVKAGTLGGGFGIATSFADTRFGLRAAIDGGSLSRSGTYDSNAFQATFNFSSIELLGDVYLAGGLRLTAGAIQSSNKLDVTASDAATQGVTFNGVRYPVSAASAEVDLGGNRFNPYLGLGYSSRPNAHGGLGCFVDAGVMFQQPTSSITVQGAAPLLIDPTFQANKAAEERKLQDSASSWKNWPVVSIGLSYAF